MNEERPVYTFNTIFNADCVEWCPVQTYEDYFVCGTYQLEVKDNKDSEEVSSSENARIGCIHFLQFEDSKNALCVIQQLDTEGGVLDAKWCRHLYKGSAILGTATSDGSLVCYKISECNNKANLVQFCKTSAHSEGLALSLDWSSAKYNSCEPQIAVSDSGGKISIFQLTNFNLQNSLNFSAHDYEAWVVAFDYFNPVVIYSGGDDGKFKGWDTRMNSNKPLFNIRNNVGVTCIQSNCWSENVLVTGSYDEYVCFWDNRNIERPLHSLRVNGGVWRLKWQPGNGQLLLAACMHNGFHVIRCSSLESTPTVLDSFVPKDSLAYGADWHCKSYDGKPSEWIATCSFYDKTLHLWKTNVHC